MKINIFWGELTDNSAKKEALTATLNQCWRTPSFEYLPAVQSMDSIQDTVGPLIIESLRAKERVSTRALRALDDPLVVQTKIWKSG